MTIRRHYSQLESGLFVPDSSPGERRRRGIGSQRHFIHTPGGGCGGCHCQEAETCEIFSDDFSTDDLEENWTQVSGSWSIGSGILTTASSNAILIGNATLSEFEPHGVECDVNIGNYNSGKKARILWDYQDADNYNYAEFWYNSSDLYCIYVKIVRRASGSETTIGSQYLFTDSYPTGSYALAAVKICIESNMVAASAKTAGGQWSTLTKWFSVATNTVRCGVGTAGTVGAYFDNYTLKRLNANGTLCLGCFSCAYCAASTQPNAYLMTIEGVVCAQGYPDANGSFLLRCVGGCNYKFCEWAATGIWRRATMGLYNSHVSLSYRCDDISWNGNGTDFSPWPSCFTNATREGFCQPPYWKHTFASSPYECDFDDLELEEFHNTTCPEITHCDYTNATVHISAA
jgi:hypothetical protein